MVNLLLLTSHFPPEQSAGANRPYSLYKHLGNNGVKVFVLTKEQDIVKPDGDFVFRSNSFINWRSAPLFSSKRLFRLLTYFSFRYLHIYTDSLWIKSSVTLARQIIREHKIQAIYATFPGTDTLKIGIALSEEYNLPLIAEFRDGLVFETIIRNPTWFQRRSARLLEETIVSKAKGIITIGNNLTQYFKRTYSLNNVFTVFNGFDQDDFNGNLTQPKAKSKVPSCNIFHFGSIHQSRARESDALFQAIATLSTSGVLKDIPFQLILMGSFSHKEQALVNDLKISEFVQFRDTMEKREGINLLLTEADALLFYGVEGQSTIISSKLPEYLNMGIPILGICKGNEAADIILDTQTGLVSDFDHNSIVQLFKRFLSNDFSFQPNADKIKLFDRESQSMEIAKIIQSVC